MIIKFAFMIKEDFWIFSGRLWRSSEMCLSFIHLIKVAESSDISSDMSLSWRNVKQKYEKYEKRVDFLVIIKKW